MSRHGFCAFVLILFLYNIWRFESIIFMNILYLLEIIMMNDIILSSS